jgi:hypothetical protein
MLTGKRAVLNGEELTVIHRVLSETLNAPSQSGPGIDPRIDEIVHRAVEKHPDARYPDACAMKLALDRIPVPVAVQGIAEPYGSPPHSTSEFLLQRMKHRPDFPAFSQRLSTINQLTGDSSEASIKSSRA